MKAVICKEYGAPELLFVGDLPIPEPASEQVLIEVHASGASYVDTLIIQNLHQVKHELPFSPGREVAGIVQALGDGVSKFKVGDKVTALLDKGGHAEYALASVSETFLRPDNCSYHAAGGHLSVYLTSFLALRERAALLPGEKVLVLGAGGGTGLAAVDCARFLGAEVIAAASSDAKLKLAAERGAQHLVNYEQNDLEQAVKEVYPKGVDLIFDPVGGDLFEPASRCVDWNGRHMSVGFAGGKKIPQFSANRLLIKNRSALGFILMYYRVKRPDLLLKAATDILNAFSNGSLNPYTGRIGTLNDLPLMLREIMDRKMVGKAVVGIKT